MMENHYKILARFRPYQATTKFQEIVGENPASQVSFGFSYVTLI